MKIEVFAECPIDNQLWLKATYTIDELTELSKGEIASKEGSTTPKVSISFELNRSNILMLSKIEVKIDELTMVEKKKESSSLNLAKTAKVTKVSADEDKSSESEQKDQTDSEKTTDELSKEETADAPQETKEEAPEEKIMEEKLIPHSYPFSNIREQLSYVRKIEKGNRVLAEARIRKLETRDEDKKKNDAAKNDFESLVLDFRSWLNDDENLAYTTESEREKFVEKCNDGEDWLYAEGSNAGQKEYQTKGYDLKGTFSQFKTRKSEDKLREETIPKMKMRQRTLGMIFLQF